MTGAMESRHGGLEDRLLPPVMVVFLISLTSASSLPSPQELVLVGEDGVPGPLLLAALELMDENQENVAKAVVEDSQEDTRVAVVEEPVIQELAVKVCDDSKDFTAEEKVTNKSETGRRKGRGRVASRYRNPERNPEVKVARRRVRVQNRVRQKRKLSMDGRGENMLSAVSAILETDPTLQLATSTRKLKSRMERRRHLPRVQEEAERKEETGSENQIKEVVRPVRQRMRIPTRNLPRKKETWNEHKWSQRGQVVNKEKRKRGRVIFSRKDMKVRGTEKKAGEAEAGRRRGSQHISKKTRSKLGVTETETVTVRSSTIDPSDDAAEVTTESESGTTSGSGKTAEWETASTGSLTVGDQYQDGVAASDTALDTVASIQTKPTNTMTSMKTKSTDTTTSMEAKPTNTITSMKGNNTTYMESNPTISYMETKSTNEMTSRETKPTSTMTSVDTDPTYTMTSVDFEPTYTMTSIDFDPAYTVTSADNDPTYTMSSADADPTNTMTSVDFDPTFAVTSADTNPTYTIVSIEPKPTNTMTTMETKLSPTITSLEAAAYTPIDDSMQYIERMYKPTHTMKSMGPLEYKPENSLISMGPRKYKYINRILNKRPLKYKSTNRSGSRIGLEHKSTNFIKSMENLENKATKTMTNAEPKTHLPSHSVTALKEMSAHKLTTAMKPQEASAILTPEGNTAHYPAPALTSMEPHTSLESYSTNETTSKDATKTNNEMETAELETNATAVLPETPAAKLPDPSPPQATNPHTHSSMTSSASSTSAMVSTSMVGPGPRPRQTHGLRTYPANPNVRMSPPLPVRSS